MKFKTKMINAAIAAALGTVAGAVQAFIGFAGEVYAKYLSPNEYGQSQHAPAGTYVNNASTEVVEVSHIGPDKRRKTFRQFANNLIKRRAPVQSFA